MNCFSPFISVVIPTLNREEQLKKVLSYFLEVERYPFFEIIVIDKSDYHEPATVEFLLKIKNKIIYEKVDYKSLTRARNHGTKLARGEIVVFVDDDTEPLPGFLTAHASPYRDPKIMGVTGSVLQNEQQRLINKEELNFKDLEKIMQGEKMHFQANFSYPASWATGCNCSFRKGVLKKLGGFDENFYGAVIGDDSEFSHRVKKIGGLIYYTPSACLVHKNWPNGGCRETKGTTEYFSSIASNINYFWFKIGVPVWYRYWMLTRSFRQYICKQNMLSLRYLVYYTLSYFRGIISSQKLIANQKGS